MEKLLTLPRGISPDTILQYMSGNHQKRKLRQILFYTLGLDILNKHRHFIQYIRQLR